MYKMLKSFLLLLVCHLAWASPSIEQVKHSIIVKLTKHNSAAIIEFNNFYNQFDRSIHLFFDKKNDQSLASHIKRIESEVETLKAVCADPAFVSVAFILKEHYAHVKDLIIILRSYVGSINSVAFALKVKRFEFLLPKDIKERGHFSLFRSLHHRLMC